MTTKLTAQATRLVRDLKRLRFGTDDDISGADTVDAVNRHLELLRKLPALAELAEVAEACRVAGGRDEFANHLARLYDALNKLKGA